MMTPLGGGEQNRAVPLSVLVYWWAQRERDRRFAQWRYSAGRPERPPPAALRTGASVLVASVAETWLEQRAAPPSSSTRAYWVARNALRHTLTHMSHDLVRAGCPARAERFARWSDAPLGGCGEGCCCCVCVCSSVRRRLFVAVKRSTNRWASIS
jgi:hypothetical protein